MAHTVYPSRTQKLPVGLRLMACALFWLPVTAATAAEFRYQATTEFPVIDAASTPFYRDQLANLDVLAINAANEAYRNRFARASRSFDGPSDHYDIELTSLGEVDGEGVYRVLVDNEVRAIFFNSETSTDFAEQLHRVERVYIASGAELSVDAMALSNGQIPEGDGYAFARGRWRSLALVTSDTPAGGQPDQVDLALEQLLIAADDETGQPERYQLHVRNLSSSVVATGVSVRAVIPDGVRAQPDEACSLDGVVLECPLPELAAAGEAAVQFGIVQEVAGSHDLSAVALADQVDFNPDNTVRQWLLDDATAGMGESGESEPATETEPETDTNSDTVEESEPTPATTPDGTASSGGDGEPGSAPNTAANGEGGEDAAGSDTDGSLPGNGVPGTATQTDTGVVDVGGGVMLWLSACLLLLGVARRARD